MITNCIQLQMEMVHILGCGADGDLACPGDDYSFTANDIVLYERIT